MAGWIGFITSLSAYYLLSERKFTGSSTIYQSLQLTSFIFLGLGAYTKQNWSMVWLEIIFSIIALKTLFL